MRNFHSATSSSISTQSLGPWAIRRREEEILQTSPANLFSLVLCSNCETRIFFVPYFVSMRLLITTQHKTNHPRCSFTSFSISLTLSAAFKSISAVKVYDHIFMLLLFNHFNIRFCCFLSSTIDDSRTHAASFSFHFVSIFGYIHTASDCVVSLKPFLRFILPHFAFFSFSKKNLRRPRRTFSFQAFLFYLRRSFSCCNENVFSRREPKPNNNTEDCWRNLTTVPRIQVFNFFMFESLVICFHTHTRSKRDSKALELRIEGQDSWLIPLRWHFSASSNWVHYPKQ